MKNPTTQELQLMNNGLRYYYKHREKINLKRRISGYQQNYYISNKEYFRQKNKEFAQRNKGEKSYGYHIKYSMKYRLKLFQILGEKCIKCGFSDKRALQFDHINGGGNQERNKLGTRSFYTKYALRPELAISTLQVLCANCNSIKRCENNETSKGWKLRLERKKE